MDQSAAFDPVHSLVFLTNRVGRLLSNHIRRHAAEDMESIFPHIGVLVDLWMHDGVQQHDLAMSVIKDKGTIARSLDVLERAGLVLRTPDEQDRRKKRIFLTRKGRGMQRKLMPQALEAVRKATQGLTEEELATCRKVLAGMYRNLSR